MEGKTIEEQQAKLVISTPLPVKPKFVRKKPIVELEHALRGIPKLSFRNLVHQMVARYRPPSISKISLGAPNMRVRRCDLRIQKEACDVMQAAAEEMLTERFKRCKRLAELCKIDTVRREHWRFVDTEEEKG